jgi:hypothetical protein
MSTAIFDLTDDEIDRQKAKLRDGKLPELARARWAVLLGQLPGFASRAAEIATSLEDASGVKAQQLLAALERVKGLRSKMGTVTIPNLVTRNRNDDRLGWAAYGATVLGLAPATTAGSTSGGASARMKPAIGACPGCGCAPCACRRGLWL